MSNILKRPGWASHNILNEKVKIGDVEKTIPGWGPGKEAKKFFAGKIGEEVPTGRFGRLRKVAGTSYREAELAFARYCAESLEIAENVIATKEVKEILRELTAEKFIDNPFANAAFNRLYKTGDLARYLPDGNIECFGRIDNQVKIRGFRIELGEIEAVLNQNIDVQTSCVIIREDTPGDKYLVAYIVAHYERIPMISELRQFLSSKLPLYMVPQAFVFLESLPLTTNRKVDRRALPAPDKIGNRRDQYVAPRNGIEEMLVQIWTEILKIEQVGIYDNFFEIGGHSLLATQLVSRIRSLFKIELPLRSLFGAATVAELAHLIGQLQHQNLTLTVPVCCFL